MDLLALLRLLKRQLLVVIPATMITIGLFAATVVYTAPTYRASSSVVLFNPPPPPEIDVKSSKPNAAYQNPYARFGDLSIVVDILRRIMTSNPVGEKLKSEGLVGTYTVEANVDFLRGPIIDVASEAGTVEGTLADTTLVLDEMTRQLAALQAEQGTSPDYYIKSQVVVSPTRATRVFSSTLRRLIAVGVLGFGLVLGAAVAADALSRRRRRQSTLSK